MINKNRKILSETTLNQNYFVRAYVHACACVCRVIEMHARDCLINLKQTWNFYNTECPQQVSSFLFSIGLWKKKKKTREMERQRLTSIKKESE